MITETYKGRKIRIVKGRGTDFGYSRVTLNGTELGKWLGDESKVQGRIRGSIDGVDAVGGINGDKYGAEWYAPGTFEVCENGHPKEIGGECLHSYCIERRPVPAATEPAPRPAMKRKNIRITPKMVEALENTIKISDRMAEALTDTVLIEETHRLHSVTVGTTVALMNRGLVRYDVTLSREEGYPVHTLTPRGRYLKGCLETCPDGREFLTSVVDGGVRKLAPVAPTGKANVREVSKVLKAAGFTPYNPERGGSRSGYQASQDGPRVLVRWREGADTDMMGDTEREDTRAGLNDAYADALTAAGYPMRGRAAGGRVAVSGSKGPARYATRNTADGVHEVVDRETGHVLSTEATSYEAREMADWYNASGFTGPAPETTSPVTEYSVKIWYRSGAYEGDMHCPEELARKIYADAAASDGVEFAELHGPSGELISMKAPDGDPTMDKCEEDCDCAVCGTLVMGPNPEWRPVLVTETLIRRCCFCQGDKQVHHHTALAMPVCHDCAGTF